MKYRLSNLKMQLDYSDSHLVMAVAKKIKIDSNLIKELTILRRSIDARKRPVYILTVTFKVSDAIKVELGNEIQVEKTVLKSFTNSAQNKSKFSPVVIGAGPAGLMATVVLAKNGMNPILLERGGDVQNRTKAVSSFWNGGELNENNNVLFGEGGAGLFSDGKLTCRSKDKPAVRMFLKTLVECGAPENILYDAEPHLGSDLLKNIVKNIRELIVKNGGQIFFDAHANNLEIKNGKLIGVNYEGKFIETDSCILATGHSARDIYKLLADKNVSLEPKPFAMGVRLELPQVVVNKTQWGKYFENPLLGSASFKLTRKPQNGFRACYSFCMCPGGLVIPCASEKNMFTTNGMSLHARDLPLANAAFLVPVFPKDFEKMNYKNHASLGGLAFQEDIEKKVFIAGGANYSIPVSNLDVFLNRKNKITRTKQVSFKRLRNVNLHTILPQFISDTLVESIPKMMKIFNDISYKEITLYAAETRSSSPVRITRNENRESVNVLGLYPCGEGAGYAGGIVSSGIDGIKSAQALLKK